MEGDLLTFGVTAQGGGGAWPALSTSSLPSGADFTDNLDGTGSFEWTPLASQTGNYSVVFRAQSDGMSDSEIVLIQVTSVPLVPPVDTVYITSDTVFAGDTAEVELVLVNPDSGVAGLNIWLKTSPEILFDTMAKISPRFPIGGMDIISSRFDSINVVSLLMFDLSDPLDYVAPGSGPLIKLRFAVPVGQPPGVYAVDTTSQIVPNALGISYRSGLSAPRVGFVPGQIVVQ